jgi:Co/Zn/Cd efflux system component
MDDCCGQKAEEIKSLRGKHKNVLIIVLVINAVLFVVEAAAGFIAQSTALLADSLDMLGDWSMALVCTFCGEALNGKQRLLFSKVL